MFDNLVRRDPRDSGKTIIPDLAHSWEIAKDGKTYTFHLRKDVQFHDGAEFTVGRRQGDLRPHRQAAGGRLHPALHAVRLGERDQRAATRTRSSSSSPSRGRPASSWRRSPAAGTCIVRKKTLEDNQYNLRRVVDIPGTGPFKSKRRVENEVWVMENNPNYWNKGLPYLDGIEFYHALPFSPELGSAVLSGRVDYARIVDPVTSRKAKATPRHVVDSTSTRASSRAPG